MTVDVAIQELQAFNLTVDGFHTYFVAGDADADAIWVHNACFADAAKLTDHFNRHGSDFGARSATEYRDMASDFLTNPRGQGVLEKTRANGDVVRFDPNTDSFGVLAGDGTIRTFYKPDPAIHGRATNLDYFNDQ